MKYSTFILLNSNYSELRYIISYSQFDNSKRYVEEIEKRLKVKWNVEITYFMLKTCIVIEQKKRGNVIISEKHFLVETWMNICNGYLLNLNRITNYNITNTGRRIVFVYVTWRLLAFTAYPSIVWCSNNNS